jgi:hypothetical protein
MADTIIKSAKMEEIQKKIDGLNLTRFNYELRARDLRRYIEDLKKWLRSDGTNKNELSLQLMAAEDELECETIPGHKALVKQIAELEKKKAEMA